MSAPKQNLKTADDSQCRAAAQSGVPCTTSTTAPGGSKTTRRHPTVAYLCMEFAVREGLDLYSGGLGILAGDVVKTAADKDIPLFGVGILWDEGYTHQTVTADGSVCDSYPKTNREELIMVKDVKTISVVVGKDEIQLRVFTPKGLENKLYLLEPVEEKHRKITKRLYQGSSEDRLAQEVVLGVGAVRLVRALDIPVDYFHFNEGHAIFAGLELLREAIEGGTKSFAEGLAETKTKCLFTTHTPVKAGNETHKLTEVLSVGGEALGFSLQQLEDIGGSPFGMSEAAFTLACRCNAVSQLHRDTAAVMWKALQPPVKIVAITNGVHTPSWRDPEMTRIFDEEVKAFQKADVPTAPKELKDDKLWATHIKAKKDLIDEIEKLSNGKIKLDVNSLLVGFARRAATYKRHTLLFHRKAKHMLEELQAASTESSNDKPSDDNTIKNTHEAPAKDATPKSAPAHKKQKDNETVLGSFIEEGKVQVVFSGKAHPCDEGGKMQIKVLCEQQKEWPRGLFYVENYNMKIGRLLTRGCDMWLNNPVRPMEASGTSGMKAAMNGVLNCSILDGWWPEGCVNGVTGWQIGDGKDVVEGQDVDERDSALLSDVMMNEVVPAYYDDAEKLKWRNMMRQSIKMSQWEFSSERMMQDYQEKLYDASDKPVGKAVRGN